MAIQVEITGRSLLRPSASYGVGEKVPLSVFDSASTDGYIPIVFAWNTPAPVNCALRDGLLAAVAMFPRLAGRFAVDDHGRTCFHLNNAGVLVVEASAAADLADALGDDDVLAGHVTQLYPRAEKERADEPVLQVQLTRYTCGGLVIGMASHHQAADGQSMSSFATVWANAVRTKSAVHLGMGSSPFHGHVGIKPRIPPAPAFDHRNIEFKGEQSRRYGVVPLDRIKNLAAHFPDEFVTGLKARVSGPGKRPSSSSSSTFKCLLAHVWKKVTVARDLAPDEFTQVRVAVNCRGRAKPPVPTEFFGNMVLWAFPRMKVRELLSSSYEAVVGAISDAIARVDDDYIKSFVDFGSAGVGELEPTAATLGTVFCPDLEVDSWLGFRFHDLDFGCGPPCAFLPPDLPIDGVMVLVPSCATKGGVDLFMGLNHDHVQAFNNMCYSMDDWL